MVVLYVLYPTLTADIEALKAGQHAHFLPTALHPPAAVHLLNDIARLNDYSSITSVAACAPKVS